MNCGDCKFYLADGGVCRRDPPVPLVLSASNDLPERVVSFFPSMTPQGWCGEHKEKRK